MPVGIPNFLGAAGLNFTHVYTRFCESQDAVILLAPKHARLLTQMNISRKNTMDKALPSLTTEQQQMGMTPLLFGTFPSSPSPLISCKVVQSLRDSIVGSQTSQPRIDSIARSKHSSCWDTHPGTTEIHLRPSPCRRFAHYKCRGWTHKTPGDWTNGLHRDFIEVLLNLLLHL